LKTLMQLIQLEYQIDALSKISWTEIRSNFVWLREEWQTGDYSCSNTFQQIS
jgi:hypothetical protein